MSNWVVLGALISALVAWTPGPASAGSGGGGTTAPADFNGDGLSDLVVGSFGEDVGMVDGAGAVNVLYGTSAGLTASGSQFWHQGNIPSTDDGPEADDQFGQAVATGDFDGDGFEDLVVGVPSEGLGTEQGAGAVHILYGSLTGLTVQGAQYFTQGALGNPDDGSEAFDAFGGAVAGGDYDGDGLDDLAVGAAGEDVGSISNAGAVNVIYGSASGLQAGAPEDGVQWLHQDSPGLFGDGAEASDNFAGRLASGNLGNGPQADLVVSVVLEDVGAMMNAGAVNVLFGSPEGITTENSEFWHQDRPGVNDAAEAQDNFGVSLAIGNFGKGPPADLAVGVRAEGVAGVMLAGAANVLYGTAGGLTSSGDQFFHQARQGMAGDGPEEMDLFAWSSTAGNFGKTPHADVAFGVILEDLGGTMDAGAVNVLYGSADGLRLKGDQFWHQNKPGVAGDGAEAGDNLSFGALAAGRYGKGPQRDLAVGVINEGVGSVMGAGAVNVLYGGSTGLSAKGDQFWHQSKPGVAGDGAEDSDGWGWRLA